MGGWYCGKEDKKIQVIETNSIPFSPFGLHQEGEILTKRNELLHQTPFLKILADRHSDVRP